MGTIHPGNLSPVCRSTRTWIALLAVGLAGLLSVSSAQATNVDLLDQANIQLNGSVNNDNSGWSVAGVGDVNGDGRDDVSIGTPWGDPTGSESGYTYVIYGQNGNTEINLSSFPRSQGFRIDGYGPGDDRLGWSVSGAGDMNGDGRDDLLIGAHRGDPSGRSNAGVVYVIFGVTNSQNVSISSLPLPGPRGFKIDGAAAGNWAGTSVSRVGDLNGDELDDIVLGANGADNNSRTDSGSAYVIYGRSANTNIDLNALTAAQGFRMDGAAAGDMTGYSVSGAGDVNGDGYRDVVVGAPGFQLSGTGAPVPGPAKPGASYVIYGAATNANLDLSGLTSARGFKLDGAASGDFSGNSVSGAGDMNGDGLADVVIGAYLADYSSRADSGSGFVVYGTASGTNLNLGSLTTAEGFRAGGAAAGDQAGNSVSGAGDVNGDGLADVIIGAPLLGSSNPWGFGWCRVRHLRRGNQSDRGSVLARLRPWLPDGGRPRRW